MLGPQLTVPANQVRAPHHHMLEFRSLEAQTSTPFWLDHHWVPLALMECMQHNTDLLKIL